MFIIKKIIAAFLLPPGIFIFVLMIAGCRAFFKKNSTACLSMLSTATLLWLISISPVANIIKGRLESDLTIPNHLEADVIIMLGGSLYGKSPDLSGTGTPGPNTMERMVTAARLHRKINVPIIISGGSVYKTSPSMAKITKRFFVDLGIPADAIIIEDRSRDTYENAVYCKTICEKNGFTKPLMVTSGYHIKRAMLSFQKVGLEVIPFPCAITTWPDIQYGWHSFLPSAKAMAAAAAGLHEWIGLIYYRLRYL